MQDAFDHLGLPRQFRVDAAELERAYLARSRAVHPDYHLTGSVAAVCASQELSAALNEAYNVLRDPFARAEHLLALEGGPSATEQKQVPGAFLSEMLDAREEIEAARGDAAAAERLEQDFRARYDALMGEVAGLFEQLAGSGDRTGLCLRIRGLLNAAKYVRGLLRDLHSD